MFSGMALWLRYYAIVGGRVVELIRTKDFKTWERSPNRPFVRPPPDPAPAPSLVFS